MHGKTTADGSVFVGKPSSGSLNSIPVPKLMTCVLSGSRNEGRVAELVVNTAFSLATMILCRLSEFELLSS
jgi:hypothetical protein